jgi:capsular polysaccharide biosynthesis protein
MEKKKRLAGRFLPSRVYSRWKWTVRSGLSALPLALLLTGCVVLYLTPNRYQSTVVFEYLGKRPPVDVAALMKTGQVINLAAKELKLTELFGMDSESLREVVARDLKVKVERGTGFIELKVTDDRKEGARDLAEGLVKALDTYEKSIALSEIELRQEELRQAERDAEDLAEEKLKDVTRLVRMTGGVAADALSQLEIDAARGDWDAARQQVRELQNQSRQAEREIANPGKWVTVLSSPSLSSMAVKPETTLDEIIFRSFAIGLGFALLAPYLLELAFPQVYRPRNPKRGEWEKEMADAGLAELPA